jgi:hypothetical protein
LASSVKAVPEGLDETAMVKDVTVVVEPPLGSFPELQAETVRAKARAAPASSCLVDVSLLVDMGILLWVRINELSSRS